MVKVSVIEQLVDIYLDKEWWHERKLSREEATKYFIKLIDNKNILYYEYDGVVVGYVEFWRVNFEQLGRIICKQRFSAYNEDISNGKICYLADIYIDPEYRHTQVVKMMKLAFFQHNYNCEFFIGEPRTKYKNTVKIYTRGELWEKKRKQEQ